MIPNIIIQAGKYTKYNKVIKYYKLKYSNYEYQYFIDSTIINYFQNNFDPFFPDIINKFNLLKGPHKIDLFRYYFLYKNGGIYFDTDMELISDLKEIIEDFDLITVITSYKRHLAMNGFIACIPNHPIIYNALVNIYNFNYSISTDYLYFCKKLYTFIDEFEEKNTVKLLNEKFIGKKTAISDTHQTHMYHHYKDKEAPYNKYEKFLNSLSKEIETDVWENVFNNKGNY